MADKNKKDHDKKGFYDPDAIAVALEYKEGESKSPKVVASGKGYLAEQILQLAFANNVKVRKDADLAQILSAVEIDTEIPMEVYAAVAEILSYVYQANDELKAKKTFFADEGNIKNENAD